MAYRGDKLPGTSEVVFLMAIDLAGRPLYASEVRRLVAGIDQEAYTVGTVRSYCNCASRLAGRGWIARIEMPRGSKNKIRYALTLEGRRVMGVVLGRIDGLRRLMESGAGSGKNREAASLPAGHTPSRGLGAYPGRPQGSPAQ